MCLHTAMASHILVSESCGNRHVRRQWESVADDEPSTGEYAPPDCEFNRVAINFTVVSEGRQL